MADCIVLQMDFQKVSNEGKEIGIEGVKKLINENENSSLQKELKMITNFVKRNSIKRGAKNITIKDKNNLLEDDLTIIGIGK